MKNALILFIAAIFASTLLKAEITKNTKTYVPVMTTVQRTSLVNTPKGLMVYDNDTKSYWLYLAEGWQQLAGITASPGQKASGNGAETNGASATNGTSNVASPMVAMSDGPANMYLGFSEAGNVGSYSGSVEDFDISNNSTGNVNDEQYKSSANGSIAIRNGFNARSIRYCIAIQGAFPRPDTVQPGPEDSLPVNFNSSDPLPGEIKLFAGVFPPKGWMFCEGQLLPINHNTSLFTLIGTMYGGNGTTHFALPDLRNAVPVPVPATTIAVSTD